MGIKKSAARAAAAACAAAVLCAGASAQADIAFTSVPDLTAAAPGDWNATYPQTIASEFTLSQSTNVSAFDFASLPTSTWVGTEFVVFADDNGAPGQQIYVQATDAADYSSTLTSNSTQVVHLNVEDPWFTVLAPGNYWFDIAGLAGSNLIFGNFNGSNPTLLCTQWTTCVPAVGSLGFDVVGGATPPPTPPSGAPEASTWAMVILGVFMLGLGLRQRRGRALALT